MNEVDELIEEDENAEPGVREQYLSDGKDELSITENSLPFIKSTCDHLAVGMVKIQEEDNHTTEPTVLFDTSFNIRNVPGFQDLIQELSDNFAVDLHSILNETLPTTGGEPMVDSSQNFVFEFQVEGNLHNL